jgi:flagellar biogenesis protein FliO
MELQARQTARPVANFIRTAMERLTKPSQWRRRRDLRVCETLSLGNRNFVAVVGYQEQRFLIAGTATTISLLADVSCEPAVGGEDEEQSSAA